MRTIQKLYQKLKDRAGFLSIETVIVAGLMIGMGAFVISQLYLTGHTTTADAVDRINQVMDIQVIGRPIP